MGKHNSIFYRGASMAALALALASVAPGAWAQDPSSGASAASAPSTAASTASTTTADQAPSTPANAKPDNEIIVTGSRVSRTTFNSPTPVNVVSAARLQDLGIPDVADALNQLPSFRATTTPATDLFRVSGAIGANSPDLRGLGATRTLTLVDGRRFVPSSDNGTVDLNGIPSALVKSTEIVTGGASAQYGADAVAGVVNLILDTRMNGVKTDFSAGVSQRGDNQNYNASIAGGTDYAGGRGHFVAGFEYQTNLGVGECQTRSWCSKYTNYVVNPGYIGGVSTNGLPANLVLNNVNFVYTPTGVILSAVQTVNGVKTTLGQQVNNTGATLLQAGLQGQQFSQSGATLVPFQVGNYLSGNFMQGGDPAAANDWGFGEVPLVTPTWHASFYGHTDYDLTPHIQAYGELMYSHVNGGVIKSAFIEESPSLSITNPFITPAVRAQILAANPNITNININSVQPDAGPQAQSTSVNDIWRTVVGLKGDVLKDWHWDAYYEHGETQSHATVDDTRLSTFESQAINAITPPAGYTGTIYTTPAGAPVICASSVAAPTNGCIPANLLGANALTPAVIAKYFQNEFQNRQIKQDDVAVNLRGSPFSTWAGAVQTAAGGEWRSDSDVGGEDALTAAGLFTAPQVTALPRVARTVEEAYIEGNVPLLAGLPFIKSISIDATGRFTHYSAFGNAMPWKLAYEYEVSDELMFRVTQSRDIREPTPQESNPNTITTILPLVDPFGGGTHSIATITGGNPNLKLEKANTVTAGVVIKPAIIPHFRVSLDYYNIVVHGAIDTLTAANALTACFSQNLACNLITFSGAYKASPAASVLSNYQNLDLVHAQGYEIVSEYVLNHVLGGDVHFTINANYVIDLVSVGATGLVTQMDGVTGNAGSLTAIAGVPRYKLDGLVTYARPDWSLTAHARYIPQSILDPTKIGPGQAGYNVNLPNSISNNFISAIAYLDLSGQMRLPVSLWNSNKMELYGGIYNVFDSGEPPELRLFGNPLQYDPVGRAFRIGVRSNW